MLVWVNGPFGGGKTQAAHELHRRVPGSVVCDPELVGYGLHRMTPPALRGDFQDLRSWRHGVYEVLARTLAEFPGHVIVPMTLANPAYFTEIIGRLRAEGHLVHHVALLADRRVVVRRLRERSVGRDLQKLITPDWVPRREAFALADLDRCLDQLSAPLFAEHLRTDELTVPEVAERIGTAADLEMLPNPHGPAQQRLLQWWTSVRHLRVD